MGRLALTLVVAACSFPTAARGEAPDIPVAPPAPIAQPPPIALVPADCGCSAREPEPVPLFGPSREDLEGLLAGGAGVAIASYFLGTQLARSQDHSLPVVDNIPIVGAVASAARNSGGRDTPLLLFSAGVQAMGLLIVAATASDLAELKRLSIEVGPNGCGASFTWRFP